MLSSTKTYASFPSKGLIQTQPYSGKLQSEMKFLRCLLGHPVLLVVRDGFESLPQFNTYSMKTYVLLHFENKNYVTLIVKLCIELLAASEDKDKFIGRQKLLNYLVFQLVVLHNLNVCDIPTSACDTVRQIPSMTSKSCSPSYFEHSFNWYFLLHSLRRYIIIKHSSGERT